MMELRNPKVSSWQARDPGESMIIVPVQVRRPEKQVSRQCKF